ncbi:MAG: hypothetical protein RL747_1419, partial [Bacteroidota bacterium]
HFFLHGFAQGFSEGDFSHDFLIKGPQNYGFSLESTFDFQLALGNFALNP